MFSTVPNTPYFRSLTSVTYENPGEVSFAVNEVLNKSDQTDFRQSSSLRKHCVVVGESTFYVNLSEIGKTSSKLPEQLKKVNKQGVCSLDINSSDFEKLLRHICPSSSGLFKEPVHLKNVASLLHLAKRFDLSSVTKNCSDFLRANQIIKITLNELTGIYSLLEGATDIAVKSCVVKAILEHEDQSQLMEMMLSGATFPCYPVIKAAMKKRDDLRHETSFVNSTTPKKCVCSGGRNEKKRLFERTIRPSSPSLCGLLCQGCDTNCCSNCQMKLCKGKIEKLLVEVEEAQKNLPKPEERASAPESPSSDVIRSTLLQNQQRLPSIPMSLRQSPAPVLPSRNIPQVVNQQFHSPRVLPQQMPSFHPVTPQFSPAVPLPLMSPQVVPMSQSFYSPQAVSHYPQMYTTPPPPVYHTSTVGYSPIPYSQPMIPQSIGCTYTTTVQINQYYPGAYY